MGGVVIDGAGVRSSVVNVYVPRDVHYDLPKMQKVTADILGRLGCLGCHSGRILNFHVLENFVVNSKLDVHELAGTGELG